MSLLVFGWGRKKKKADGSQIAAAAAAAASAAAAEASDAEWDEPAQAAHGRQGAPPRGGEEAGIIDPTSIDVANVPTLLRDVAGVRDRALVAGAASLREAMLPRLEKLASLVDELDEDDLDMEDADRRVQAVVERGKRQIISIIGQEARAVLPGIETADDAIALAEATGRMLKKTTDVLGRQKHILHTYAKKYAGRIKPILEAVEDDYEELAQLAAGREFTADMSQRILDDIDRMDKSEKSAERLRARAAELESRLAQLRRHGEDIAGEIEGVKSSPEYGALGRLREELDAVRGRRAAARRAASDRFTKISKPLSRYEYVSAMDKEKMALLRAVIDDPFEAVASSGAGAVSEILGAAKRAVEGGSVSVKDRAKAAGMLGEEAGRLASYEEAAARMAGDEEAIKSRIAEADTGRLDALESDRARNAAESGDTEAKVRRMRAEADEADGRVPGILARIQSSVSDITGVRYTVSAGGSPWEEA